MNRFLIYIYVLPCIVAAAVCFSKGFGFWSLMGVVFSIIAIAVLTLPFLPIWR